jgi:hypothetical protein
MKQLRDGYYWLLASNNDRPEIVLVDNNYIFRRKVTPMVIGVGWKGPLSDPFFDLGQWEGPIHIPASMVLEAAKRKIRAGV